MKKLQKKQHKMDLSSEIAYVKHEKYALQYEDEFIDTPPTSKKWYEQFSEDSSEHVSLPQEKVEQLKAEAKMILADEVVKHELKLSRSRSDHQWMRTVLARGTTSDKIAVHTLLIQDSPLHSLSSLESLVSMAKVAKKKECITAIETLTELFLSDLLPPSRKLRVFEACPLGDSHPSLLLSYYEDQLKVLYQSFVEALSATARDTVDANKEKAIVAMHKLLSGCPEQEVMLLRSLVNKLGDPSAKVVSKVSYCLGQLLRSHPNMKAVVMEEIEKLLFRPNVSTRAQYYCICFLGQFVFTSSDAVVAKNLIRLYFSFFKASIKKGEVDSRMMSALLMGVNRAYPFAKSELQHISEHVDTMYKVVHMANFNVGLHTLCLLYHICDQANSLSDRFYCALYKKIADPDLVTSGHQAMFLSLMFRALRKDTHNGRIRAFVKKLLQVCLYAPVPLACGILYMTSQLIYRRSDLLALACTAGFADDGDDEADEHYNDVKLQEPDIAGREVQKDDRQDVEAEQEAAAAGGEAHATWQHYDNMKQARGARGRQYDPLQRNPTFAGAEHTAYVELLQLSRHFHPTVALFANNILSGTLTNYNGDPLLDFTLSRFLDRFVFKNPKKPASEDHVHPFDRKKKYVASGARALRVNSANYLNMQESTIPEDERFLYRYLYTRQAGISEREGDSDVESVASEEFEQMLDSLTGTKDHDDSLDFADHISAKSAGSRRKGGKHSDEAGSSDEGSVQDDFEESDGYSANDDESVADDASDIVFDSDGDGSEGNIANELKQFQLTNEQDEWTSHKKHKAKKKDDLRSLFASADEFAEILQDEGISAERGTLSNMDKAGVKQLRWESARDYWLNRTDKKRRKNARAGKTKKPRSR